MGFGLGNINIEPVGNGGQYTHYYGPGEQHHHEDGCHHHKDKCHHHKHGCHHYEDECHEAHHDHNHHEYHQYFSLGLNTLGSGVGRDLGRFLNPYSPAYIMFLVLILLCFGTGYGSFDVAKK